MMPETTTTDSSELFHNMIGSKSVARQIAFRVRRMVSAFALGANDADDLSQDYYLALLQAAPQFDAEIDPPELLVSKVLNQCYKQQLRDQTQRNNAGLVPLESLSSENSEDEEGEILLYDEQAEELFDRLDLACDIQTVIDQLPEPLCSTAKGLLRYSPSDLAEREEIHESTISHRIAKIRQHFEKAGLAPEQ